jgi:predicted dehydrogenase
MAIMDKIRYGIIGFGPRGYALADAALKTGEVEINAASDRDPRAEERLRRTAPKARLFQDYRSILELRDIDAVVIATPNHTHCQIALDAIAAGKNIFCEKPVGITLEEFYAVRGALQDKDITFQAGTELRYSPMGQKMKKIISEGEIGPVHMFWCREYRPPFKGGYGDWRVSPKSGGTFLEKCIHHLDLFYWFAESAPKTVHAFGGAEVLYQQNGILDNGILSIEFENNIRACLCLGLFHNSGFLMEFGVLGEKGRIDTFTPPVRMELITDNYKSVYNFERNVVEGGYNHDGEIEQHYSFVQCIRGRKKPLANIDAVYPAHAIALAAQRSIDEKRPVTL